MGPIIGGDEMVKCPVERMEEGVGEAEVGVNVDVVVGSGVEVEFEGGPGGGGVDIEGSAVEVEIEGAAREVDGGVDVNDEVNVPQQPPPSKEGDCSDGEDASSECSTSSASSSLSERQRLWAKQVEGMSSHELINNPITLKAGLSMLVNTISGQMNQRSGGGSYKTSSASDSSDIDLEGVGGRRRSGLKRQRAIPSPSAEEGAPASTSMSTNGRPKKSKKKVAEDVNANANDDHDDLLSVSSGGYCSQSASEDADTDADSVMDDGTNATLLGAVQFDELVKRFKLPESDSESMSPTKKLEKFDLGGDDIFLRGIFPDYKEKVKMCDEHSKRITELTEEAVLEHFEKIKQGLLEIFEGNAPSARMKLYVSQKKDDLAVLHGMNNTAPFTTTICSYVCDLAKDFLLPGPKARKKYHKYNRLVILPEALIRIYASVNDVTLAHAEKEIRFGPQYDGPAPKKVEVLKVKKGKRSRSKRAKENTSQYESQGVEGQDGQGHVSASASRGRRKRLTVDSIVEDAIARGGGAVDLGGLLRQNKSRSPSPSDSADADLLAAPALYQNGVGGTDAKKKRKRKKKDRSLSNVNHSGEDGSPRRPVSA